MHLIEKVVKWQHQFHIVWDFTRFCFFFQSLPPTKATTPSNSRWWWSSGSNSSCWYKIAIPNRICSLQWRWRGVYFIRSYWCHKCYYRYSGFYWHRSFDCSEAQIHTGNRFDNMEFKNYHGNANGVLFKTFLKFLDRGSNQGRKNNQSRM